MREWNHEIEPIVKHDQRRFIRGDDSIRYQYGLTKLLNLGRAKDCGDGYADSDCRAASLLEKTGELSR